MERGVLGHGRRGGESDGGGLAFYNQMNHIFLFLMVGGKGERELKRESGVGMDFLLGFFHSLNGYASNMILWVDFRIFG